MEIANRTELERANCPEPARSATGTTPGFLQAHERAVSEPRARSRVLRHRRRQGCTADARLQAQSRMTRLERSFSAPVAFRLPMWICNPAPRGRTARASRALVCA